MKPTTFLTLFLLACHTTRLAADEGSIDFNRDVRPILSDNCFACHGLDERSREADLRLDIRDHAIASRDGRPAIMPGDPQASELVRRIDSPDVDERMPPAGSTKQLTREERAILRRWIEQGAEYQQHWSLIPPTATPFPKIKDRSWPDDAIDYFVLARLEKLGIDPAREARPETLLRRVTLDLTGLPPTPEELDAFLADTLPGAYERAVDRLLASPAFGEHFASSWLDVARYADTNGYFGDKTRTAWLWRDWVIDAFNRNQPYDQFTIEQLAGDLLPAPTVAQRIATGFNRNHMANNESGSIDEEFRVEYVADRLETTAAAWFGLTVGCARCHDHKYDPISQREYYQLFAFFNNVPEAGLITKDNPPPILEVPSTEQTELLQRLTAERDTAEKAFTQLHAELLPKIATWEQSADKELKLPPEQDVLLVVDFDRPLPVQEIGTTVKRERGVLGEGGVFDATQHLESKLEVNFDGAWTVATWFKVDNSLSCLLSKIEPVGNRRGLEILWQKGRLFINLVHRWGLEAIEASTKTALSTSFHHLIVSYDGSGTAAGLTVTIDGKPAGLEVQRDTLKGTLANREPLRIGRRDSGLGFYGQLDELRLLGRRVAADEHADWYWGERLRGILNLQLPEKSRTQADRDILLQFFLDRHAPPEAKHAWETLQAARGAVARVRESIPTALIMDELPEPRQTTVLERGEYNRPTIAVQPGVPAALPVWPADAPRNRLGFAQWLFHANHPLTARVAVNRCWQHCFGEGLVRTVSDFGSQGELPSHPEVLDWLAVDFAKNGWDVKQLLRRIVTSATYRQDSARRSGLPEDPENRLLARGPSFRLSAEMIRDQALAAAGMLIPQLGGPSVKPYQPPGLWEAVSYNGEETYVADAGEGLWQRSLYSFWKRQAPPPAMLTFDASTREKCTVRRPRTNTPLQALVLLNDDTYVEAAESLAVVVLRLPGSDRERLQAAFRRLTARRPDERETNVLQALLIKQRKIFNQRPEQAEQLLSVGAAPRDQRVDAVELAAWTATLQVLFNLDEVVTRR